MSKEIKNEDKNHDFVQLARGYIDGVADLSKQPYAFRLFMFFIKNMDGLNALTVSNKALCEILNVSKPTVCRAVKYLKDQGYIEVIKSGTNNIYVINPEVSWTSYGYQKQYCKFKSNVVLSPTENAEWLKNREASFRVKMIDDSFVHRVQENKNNNTL